MFKVSINIWCQIISWLKNHFFESIHILQLSITSDIIVSNAVEVSLSVVLKNWLLSLNMLFENISMLQFPLIFAWFLDPRNTICIELNHVFQYLGGFVRNYYLVINTIWVKQNKEKKKEKNINNDRDDKKSPINLPHKSIHCFLGKFGADFIVTLFSNPYQNIPIFKQWNEHLENELLFYLWFFLHL